MKLPKPAADLWLATRDVLTTLGPATDPWTIHLGGGTVLAAYLQHRKSADIDVTVRAIRALGGLARPGPDNLAQRLGGTPIRETQGQIKIRMHHGIVDLNTAPVIPSEGHENVEISGRRQGVLSTTQILRGKLERAKNPAPVRDVYDVIRTANEPRLAGALAAAYGLLIEDEQDAIERYWILLDALYERTAAEELRLSEEPIADLAVLGSTAALTLQNHRLARLVVTIENQHVEIERTTRGGKVFTEATSPEQAGAAMNRLGVNVHIYEHDSSHPQVIARLAESTAAGAGVVFDTADLHPEHRLDGRNRSTKRAGT